MSLCAISVRERTPSFPCGQNRRARPVEPASDCVQLGAAADDLLHPAKRDRRGHARQRSGFRELPELAADVQHPLDHRDPHERGEDVDRPLQEPPGREAEADRDKHDALDA